MIQVLNQLHVSDLPELPRKFSTATDSYTQQVNGLIDRFSDGEEPREIDTDMTLDSAHDRAWGELEKYLEFLRDAKVLGSVGSDLVLDIRAHFMGEQSRAIDSIAKAEKVAAEAFAKVGIDETTGNPSASHGRQPPVNVAKRQYDYMIRSCPIVTQAMTQRDELDATLRLCDAISTRLAQTTNQFEETLRHELQKQSSYA